MVNVTPERREGAEERIAEATLRLGGMVERIERESGSAKDRSGGDDPRDPAGRRGGRISR